MQVSGADLLTQEDQASGAGLQVFAQLSANLGTVAQVLKDQASKNQRLWESIRPIPGIPVGQLTAASKFVDLPELTGPRTGYWWDIHLLVGATFTAGAVNVYRATNSTNVPDINLVGAFTSAGYLTYGKAQLMIPPGQHLIFGSNSSFSGTANLAIASVTEIAASALPDYLL